MSSYGTFAAQAFTLGTSLSLTTSKASPPSSANTATVAAAATTAATVAFPPEEEEEEESPFLPYPPDMGSVAKTGQSGTSVTLVRAMAIRLPEI